MEAETNRTGLWVALALAVPAIIIAAIQLNARGIPIAVVGAGIPLSRLSDEDSPEGFHYDLEVREHESIGETAGRVEDAIATWPDVVVIGLDASMLEEPGASAAYQATLARLVRQAEGALSVPVVIAPKVEGAASPALSRALHDAHTWWRLELCQGRGSRVCVDVPEDESPGPALAAGVREAVSRHEQWRASTQVGR